MFTRQRASMRGITPTNKQPAPVRELTHFHLTSDKRTGFVDRLNLSRLLPGLNTDATTRLVCLIFVPLNWTFSLTPAIKRKRYHFDPLDAVKFLRVYEARLW